MFHAVREYEGVRQDAALKLLRRGLYTIDAQRQFRRERHALAHLTHPDIANLIEGGVTENGLAYIVLELVDGVSITELARSMRSICAGACACSCVCVAPSNRRIEH